MKTLADKRIIEQIVPVAEFNKGKRKIDQCPKKYGYIMPIYHGYDWRKTKKQLIQNYT